LTIVRLPALFGRGLKKNIIFDLLNNNMLEKIEPRSSFQYYDLAGLWANTGRVLDAGIELCHLFPEPIKTHEMIEAFFPHAEVGSDPYPVASYDFRTIHGATFGREDGYIYGKDEVMEQLGRFLALAKEEAER
jgi:hypothetical protein